MCLEYGVFSQLQVFFKLHAIPVHSIFLDAVDALLRYSFFGQYIWLLDIVNAAYQGFPAAPSFEKLSEYSGLKQWFPNKEHEFHLGTC
jgi:hypothetical protein